MGACQCSGPAALGQDYVHSDSVIKVGHEPGISNFDPGEEEVPGLKPAENADGTASRAPEAEEKPADAEEQPPEAEEGGEEGSPQSKPSAAAAPCPCCEKHFRPRAGNAFESVTKHIRSTQDDVHQALASTFNAGRPKCLVCGEMPGDVTALVEHILCGPCAADCAARAAGLAAEGAGKKPAKQPKGGERKNKGGRNAEAQALYSAAKGNALEEVRRILEASEDPANPDAVPASELTNTKFDDGFTALMTAAEAGHAGVVSLLLEKGADPTAKNSYGQSAVHLAALHARAGAIAALVAPEKTREAVVRSDFQGAIALTWAAQNGNDKIVTSLLDAKSDVSHGGDRTPLAAAITAGHSGVVSLLLPHCDPKWVDSHGHSPLYLAVTAAAPNADVVRVLATAPGVDLRRAYPRPDGSAGKPATLVTLAREAHRDDLVKLLMPTPQSGPCCVVS